MSFAEKLQTVLGQKLESLAVTQQTFEFSFSGRLRLSAAFWRLSGPEGVIVSSFDHDETYGLDAALDAAAIASAPLTHQELQNFNLTPQNDLHLKFSGGFLLEVFTFSAYEVWELQFPDQSQYFSNSISD